MTLGYAGRDGGSSCRDEDEAGLGMEFRMFRARFLGLDRRLVGNINT